MYAQKKRVKNRIRAHLLWLQFRRPILLVIIITLSFVGKKYSEVYKSVKTKYSNRYWQIQLHAFTLMQILSHY